MYLIIVPLFMFLGAILGAYGTFIYMKKKYFEQFQNFRIPEDFVREIFQRCGRKLSEAECRKLTAKLTSQMKTQIIDRTDLI